ncbi:MAG: hypothetical protein IPP81_05880 [Chitinophagaceae bacterium]|nr:hypothetical protein [Chitinophagaceae bacterium]
MKKIITTMAVVTSMLVYLLSSCYKNKEDILALPATSFRADVVPIMVAGGCGCHNNGIGTRAVQFSHADTIFYDAILGRVGLLNAWVNGGIHPGAGSIYFTPNQENIIKKMDRRRCKRRWWRMYSYRCCYLHSQSASVI